MNRIINVSSMLGFATAIAFAAVFFVQMPGSTAAFGTSGNGGCCGGSSESSGGHETFYNNTPVKVVVAPKPVPTCTLTATPSSVAYGGSVTIRWTSHNATGASLFTWGGVAVNGSHVFSNLVGNTNYRLRVTGPGGTTDCTTSVVVAAKPVCPAGTTGTYPNCATPHCPVNTTGTYPNCHVITCPAGTTGTYPNCAVPTPHCPSGTTGTYPNCVVPPVQCPMNTTGSYPNCVAVSTNVDCPSGTVQNGNICIVNVNTNNNQNNNTQNNNQVVTVNVPAPVYPTAPTYPTYQNPTCTMYVSQNYAQPGQTVTLSWYSSNASYGYINSGLGSVNLSGSRTVNPYQTTTYTGTFTGYNGQQVTCSATVNMDNVYQNPVPYVTLSAVPYTGLDLGTGGTILYWAFLVAWSLFAAYLIAVKRVHMSIYRWYNGMLFGSESTYVAPTVASVSASAAAPIVHTTIDPFIVSQINR